jgi:hypothetical protein
MRVGWPDDARLRIASLPQTTPVKSVHLLGRQAPLQYSQDAQGLQVQLPPEKPNPLGPALCILGVASDDAKNETDAKKKIDDINQQLKTGDFATIARARSEDPQSVQQGGDIGFASEDDLKNNGFPSDLVGKFFGSMQIGDRTDPVRFPSGKWYIFKLEDKRLQTENLTLESQGVRQQITVELTKQRKEILDSALLEVSLAEAKIVNSFAANMLANPANLGGMRPAAASAANPGASPAASANPPPAAAKGAASPASSPAKK